MTIRRTVAVLLFAITIAAVPQRSVQAAPPEVVTSIKPVQALVKMVMGNLGTPDVILPPSASPHVFSMKPSQAKKLEDADVIFWIGPDLETTLVGPIENVAKKARVVELLKTPGLDLIHYGGEEDPSALQDDHTDQDNDHAEPLDAQAHSHALGSVDPHIWLSPSNAIVLIDAIARTMSEMDPPNAPDYQAHAKKASQRIKVLIRHTERFTAPLHETPYLTQHAGYAYLARDFDLNEVGYLQTQPGREPGAKHVAMIIEQIERDGAKCLFHESQFSSKLAERLEEEAHIGLAEIDPMGTHLTLTDDTYLRLIQAILINMESCLYLRETDKVEGSN